MQVSSIKMLKIASRQTITTRPQEMPGWEQGWVQQEGWVRDSRSPWRDSIPQNQTDWLGSITWVPKDRIGHMLLFLVFSDPSGCRGCSVFGAVLPGRMPVAFKATHQPFVEGEGDRGRLPLV